MQIHLPQSLEVDTRTFVKLMDYNTQSASYKPLWLASILEEVIKGNRKIN